MAFFYIQSTYLMHLDTLKRLLKIKSYLEKEQQISNKNNDETKYFFKVKNIHLSHKDY